MYRKFAKYYDELMSDYDYDAWSDKVVSAIRNAVPNAKEGADLACGSGNFTLRLADAGFRMIGSDASVDMLNIARNKSVGRDILYLHQGINDTCLAHPVDFITIMCDGVNYCTDGVNFNRLADCLKEGGVLVFDISSPHRLTRTLGNDFFYEDREDITYFWQNEYIERDALLRMELTFFAKNADGSYERFDEDHVMRVYTSEELTKLLRRRFEVVVYGDEIGAAPQADAQRLHFVCKKK